MKARTRHYVCGGGQVVAEQDKHREEHPLEVKLVKDFSDLVPEELPN